MDTEKCRTLLRVLELGSISAAAEDLGYTPSGVSKMMAAMESELGFTLLMRSREGVRPTRECEHMLPLLRRLSDDYALARETADSLLGIETGEIYVGTPYPAFFRTLSQLISDFCRQYPGVHVGIIEGMSSELAEKVEDRKADFCIISKREGDFDWVTLTNDPFVAIVSSDHPLNKKGSVSREDLSNEPFIMMHPDVRSDCSIYLEQNGVTPDIRFSCSDTLAAYHLVEAGLGITLDNSIYAPQFSGNVTALPLDPPFEIPIGIAMPRLEQRSPAATRFIEMSLSYF